MKINEQQIIDKIKHISDDRYLKLFDIIRLSPTCLKCSYFRIDIDDPEKLDGYRCKVPPQCIAAILHPDIANKMLNYVKEDLMKL